MDYLLRGILIGLLFGLPVGSVGALTVQRTFSHGAKAGLLTGLGSSVADCFYACVGAFGLTLISDFLLRYQTAINILGGGLILLLSIRLLLRREEQMKQNTEVTGFFKMFLTSFAVGITNPAAILTFLFAFSYFGISDNTGWEQGILLVCGVFIGTYLWWGTLTGLASIVKKKAKRFRFRQLNLIFGGILCLFGFVVFLRMFI